MLILDIGVSTVPDTKEGGREEGSEGRKRGGGGDREKEEGSEEGREGRKEGKGGKKERS